MPSGSFKQLFKELIVLGVDPVKKNIQNELLEISKDITEELLNSFFDHCLKDHFRPIMHQFKTLIGVMRNSPSLREFILSDLFGRKIFSVSDSDFYPEIEIKMLLTYRYFSYELVKAFKFSDHLLIDLIKIFVNDTKHGWRLHKVIFFVALNRKIFLQSFNDVSEFIHTILSKGNDETRYRALEILGWLPSVVKTDEKIKGKVNELFEKIRDPKYRLSFNEDFRSIVIRNYLQTDYDLQEIPYTFDFFSYIDEICPK